jgi:hypothetical protein
MILHSIIVKRESVVTYPVIHQPPFTRTVTRMGQIEYAAFIARVPHRQNDYVVNYALTEDNYTHLHASGLFMVIDIQEDHTLVEYEFNGTTHTPKCLFVRNRVGHGFWTVPARWVKAPQVILDRLLG